MEGVVILLVVGISLAAHYFTGAEATKRRLRKAQRWRIAELPEDTLGRVIGEAQPLERTLTAPITGRPCVFYVVDVIEQHGRTTSTLIHEQDGVPFALVDRSGRAIVEPHGASVALTQDARTSSGTLDDATPIEEAFLARHGRSSKGWLFNRSLSYRESVIAPGERVAILGAGVREPDPDAPPGEGYRSGPPTRLRLTSSPRFPLLISDDASTTDR